MPDAELVAGHGLRQTAWTVRNLLNIDMQPLRSGRGIGDRRLTLPEYDGRMLDGMLKSVTA
jgi:hypothetical protein